MTFPDPVRRALDNGVNVVPQVVSSAGKKPLVKWAQYQHEPVTLEQAEEWSQDFPDAHWAIVCGTGSGFIVLDFDDAELCRKLGLKPLVRTPSGGLHVWVRSPGYAIVGGSRVSDDFPKMDLRSDGQLATFYGRGYKRLKGVVYTIERLPTALRDFLRERKRGETTDTADTPLPANFTDFVPESELLSEALELVENGDSRNETGFWLACQLRDERYQFEGAWKVMLRYCRFVNRGTTHPYKKQEAYNSLVQAYAQPARQPRSLEDRNVFNRVLRQELARDEARQYIRSLKLGQFDPQVVAGLPEEEGELPWTLLELQPEATNALLVGERKAGKTSLGLNLAKSLLDSEMFLGRFKPRTLDGTVAYFNYEMSPRQFNSWLRKADIENIEGLVHWSLRGEHVDILDDSTLAKVVELLKRYETEYLIVDPWARAISGIVDENSNSEVAAFLERLDLMKHRAGVQDMCIFAHVGKNGEGPERARGASRLEDWADVIWSFSVDDRKKRFMRAEGRDVEIPEFQLDFDKETVKFTYVGGGRVEQAVESAVAEVLRTVNEEPGLTYNALHGRLTCSKSMRPRAIKIAKERGWVYVRDDPQHAQRKLHFATKGRHKK